MAFWSVDDMVKEIEDLDKLHKLKANEMLLKHCMSGLQQKINALQAVSPSMLLTLLGALDQAQLPEDVKEELKTSLENRLVQSQGGNVKLQNVPQSLCSLYNYLSAKEWSMVQKEPFNEAVHICVKRLKATGVKSMKECTKKHAIALLLHLAMVRGVPKPPGPEIYKQAVYLTECFAQSTQQSLVAGLCTYPDKPEEISKDQDMSSVLFLWCAGTSFHSDH